MRSSSSSSSKLIAINPYDGGGDRTGKDRKRSATDVIVAEGVYVPPSKRRLLQERQQQQQQKQLVEGTEGIGNTTTGSTTNDDHDKPGDSNSSSIDVQKQTWEEQKRIIYGTINRLNRSTIKPLIHDLFQKVNLLRLRGVLTKSILLATISSIQYSNVYAALISVINTKLPEIGELLVKRTILAFRKHYERKDKQSLLSIVAFIGHLYHQNVVHEILILQILTVLFDETTMTNDSVEVGIHILTNTGQSLLETSPNSLRVVLDRLRTLLHEGQLDPRVQLQLEKLLELRKVRFVSGQPAIVPELDLVEMDDQITFDDMSIDDETIRYESNLDTFQIDPDFVENEEQWNKIRAEILGLDGDEDDSDNDNNDDDATTDDSDAANEDNDYEQIEGQEETQIVPVDASTTEMTLTQPPPIQDLSDADLVHLRRTIYLTIMSSATFEECAHKLAKVEIPNGREEELINMIIECCSQERTFLRYYGLIAARFCLLSQNRWRDAFMDAFQRQYTTIHRLETNKLRNVAKLFAHLLHTDSIPWSVVSIIHLNEDETTSSSRIFIKILLQEMAEAMGIAKLKERFETDEPEYVEWYKGMFPKDNVRNTRYAINFFTSIGLGPLTDDLREYLKNAPKLIIAQAKQQQKQVVLDKGNEDDDGSTSSSSSSSSSSTSSSSFSKSSYTSSSDSRSTSSSSSTSYSSRSRSDSRRSGNSNSTERSNSTESRRGRSRRRKSGKDRKRRTRGNSSRSTSHSSSSYSSRSASR